MYEFVAGINGMNFDVVVNPDDRKIEVFQSGAWQADITELDHINSMSDFDITIREMVDEIIDADLYELDDYEMISHFSDR